MFRPLILRLPWLLPLASLSLFAADRPNILFIYLDDYGWRDAGFMGSDFYETPNLDQLAAEGMVFTNAYSAAANCAPARASLLSGQATPRHKVYNVGTDPRGDATHRRLEHIPGVDVLDPSIVTWAHLAQQQGYATASIGKWHLSDDPLPYGFDIDIGGSHSGSPPQGYYPPHPGVAGLEDAPEGEYLTDRLTAEALAFIEKNAARPWLVYLSHFAVHTPLDAKRELVAKYAAKPPGKLHDHINMATMIEAVDSGVGQLLDRIEALGQTDRTVVILHSDNGGYGPATDMHPLYGYKGTYYEGGIRVPLVVHWPGVTRPGSQSDIPVIGTDLYPTFAAIMGAMLPDHQPLDGESLMPVLRGEPPKSQRSLFWHFPAYLQSYRQTTSEQRDPLFRSRPVSVIRRGDWKLHHYYEDDGLELYNLAEDIGETRNLAATKAPLATALRAELETWLESTGADIPRASNPKFDAIKHAAAIEAASN